MARGGSSVGGHGVSVRIWNPFIIGGTGYVTRQGVDLEGMSENPTKLRNVLRAHREYQVGLFEHLLGNLPSSMAFSVNADLSNIALAFGALGSSLSAFTPALSARKSSPLSFARALNIASAIGLRHTLAVQTKGTFFIQTVCFLAWREALYAFRGFSGTRAANERCLVP